eukprot:gene16050-17672_t
MPEESFTKYLKSLFDIIDTKNEGFVRLDDLARHLRNDNNSESSNRPRTIRNKTEIQNAKIISALTQVTPVSGVLNFQRFSLAMKMAMGRVSPDSDRGMVKSLRPTSYLFAVTQSSESDCQSQRGVNCPSSYHDDEPNGLSVVNFDGKIEIEKQKAEVNNNSSPYFMNAYEVCLYENKNFEREDGHFKVCPLEDTEKQLQILHKGMQEVTQLQQWHQNSIMMMEKQRKRLENNISICDEMVESDRSNDLFNKEMPKIDVLKLDSHISKLSGLKDGLELLVNRKITNQAKKDHLPLLERIQRLEAEKAALVKELFNVRSKLNTPEHTKEAVLPF